MKVQKLTPDEIFQLRFAIEAQLGRLGLTWQSDRTCAYYRWATGLPNAILADVPEADLEVLLAKLKRLKREDLTDDT